MKSVIYSNKLNKEILAEGDYKGRHYVILNLGWHPTAYVEFFREFTQDSDEWLECPCHGSITYEGRAHWNNEDSRYYIGWDYGHYEDYSGYWDDFSNEDKNK